jgi:methyl-accepting chemotaxis protein
MDHFLGAILILTSLLGGVGWWYTHRMASTVQTLHEENLQAAEYLTDAERGLWELRFALPNYLIEGSAGRARIREAAAGFMRQVDENMKAYSALPLTQAEREHLAEWDESYVYYSTMRPRYFELLDAGKVEEAAAHRQKKTNPAAGNAVRAISLLVDIQRSMGEKKTTQAQAQAREAAAVFATLSALSITVVIALVVMLRRTIAGSIRRVQGTSTELTSAAQQQLASAKDLASSTAEISASLRSLIVTSQQIARVSAQVLGVAEETQARATEGGATVHRSEETIAGIQRKVELIAKQMTELDKSSKQISGVLALIDELAEQTNILAINATIEAAGAGDFGRRFSVIGNEVRKLADRVSGSTREVRALIGGVQRSTESTLITTREGAMAVDVGAREFMEVLTVFDRIDERIAATAAAAREIDRSTQQQISAVEQVNDAILGIMVATRQLEAASLTSMETSASLQSVSNGLAAVISRGRRSPRGKPQR